MPGIPFELAGCQGCSWTWMCSRALGDPEDNMATLFTAEEQIICLVLKPNAYFQMCCVEELSLESNPPKSVTQADLWVSAWINCGYR